MLLVDAEYEAVAATVADNNPGLEAGTAARIVDQALAYLATVADVAEPLSPSLVVDEGWHALVLHTRIYEGLCRRLGKFIHHRPERPGSTDADYSPDWLTRTTEAIRQAGFEVDEELWRGPEDNTIPVRAPVQHSPGPNCGPIVTTPKPPPNGRPKTGKPAAPAGTV